MKHFRIVFFWLGLVLAAGALCIALYQTFSKGRSTMPDTPIPLTTLQLQSSAFKDGERIPDTYTCKGENISPPLTISGAPIGTITYALVVHDPDAPVGDFLHWVVWNIPGDVENIAENGVPSEAVQGLTDFDQQHYGGPCPPKGTGTHHYVFELYALSDRLNIPPMSDRMAIMQAINDKLIGKTTLTGTFSVE